MVIFPIDSQRDSQSLFKAIQLKSLVLHRVLKGEAKSSMGVKPLFMIYLIKDYLLIQHCLSSRTISNIP